MFAAALEHDGWAPPLDQLLCSLKGRQLTTFDVDFDEINLILVQQYIVQSTCRDIVAAMAVGPFAHHALQKAIAWSFSVLHEYPGASFIGDRVWENLHARKPTLQPFAPGG